MKTIFRYIAIVLLFGSLLFLGFLRDGYVVNLHLPDTSLLINRYEDRLSLIPASPLQGIATMDPRWYNLPFFMVLMAGITLLLARLLFRRKEAARYVGLVYLGLFSLAGLITGLGWAFQLSLAYTLGQHLKELLLSPLLSLLIVAALYTEKQLRGAE